MGFVKKDVHCNHLFIINNKNMSTATIFFNLILEVSAKKKTAAMLFHASSHFFCLPQASAFELQLRMQRFFMSDASVCFTARIGISVADAQGPLIATTVANGCFSHPDANVS